MLKKTIKIFIGVLCIAIIAVALYPVPAALMDLKPEESLRIYDRNGRLLYEALNEKGRQDFISLDDIPDYVKKAFISAEDKRFYEHAGVDIISILRAAKQNALAGRIVSGGSTITQQVVRNAVGADEKRTFGRKLKESVLALKLNYMMDKNSVFEAYLNSIYFGGLAYGIESASWQYFDKSVRYLDLAESAFLAGLPQAPNKYFPYKYFDRAKERQKTVLKAMFENGVINKEEYESVLDEKIDLRKKDYGKKAPHFVDFILSSGVSSGEINTTLDLGMQEKIASILNADLSFLSKFNINNGAVVVLDAGNGEILAMVGSKDHSDESIDGEVNATVSLRQPGSAIKPLVYAAAMEKGWSADTIISDEPVGFETEGGLLYSPQNYDLEYHGDVTVAEALAQSLNVPAVKTLDFVGVSEFLGFARKFGITTLNEGAEHYGFSLALGSGEVKLLELVSAYSVFANKGYLYEAHFLPDNDDTAHKRVISENTADTIKAILADNHLRMPAFGEESPLNLPFPVSAKTGTTRNFRDNWTVGFTDKYAVGVWVGNADGAVMEGVSGITGAAPIFNKVIMLVGSRESGVGNLECYPELDSGSGFANCAGVADGAVMDEIPDSRCKIRGRQVRDDNLGIRDYSSFHIITPFDGDVFLFDPEKPADSQKIGLRASKSAEWYIDDVFIGEGDSVLWQISRGKYKIKALRDGEEDELAIWVN